MFKHNLTARLNLQREDKNGKYPLRLRTIIQRKATYYATGITLKLNQWDDAKKEITNHPQKTALNALLRKKMAELEAQLIDAALKGEPLKKPKKKNSDFILFCEAKVKEHARTNKATTITHKRSEINVLRAFRAKIPFDAIALPFLHQYEDYCKKTLRNSANTVWKHLKFVKIMIREAVKEELLEPGILMEYKMPKYVDPERDYLILSEVDKIEQFRDETEIDKLRNTADWFLFSCYTGFRYEDVKKFSRDKIQQGKIILRTSKKGTDVTLAIHPRLQKVIDRMPSGVYSNQKLNDFLKVIAANVGIDKNLSMHVGRHTFAVIFLELGGSMEALSKLLAHTKMSTTQIYGKITNRRLDDEMRKVWG